MNPQNRSDPGRVGPLAALLLLPALLAVGCGPRGPEGRDEPRPAAAAPDGAVAPERPAGGASPGEAARGPVGPADGAPPAEGAGGPRGPGEPPPPEPAAPPPVDEVRIFLVEVEPRTGDPEERFGCGDRLVGVVVPPPADLATTAGRVAGVLGSLLPAAGGVKTPRGLYNALERSALTVERVEAVVAVAGLYRVVLAGDLVLGGVCDHPRVRAQLEATATQFPEVHEIEVFVGDQPLDALLTGRGL